MVDFDVRLKLIPRISNLYFTRYITPKPVTSRRDPSTCHRTGVLQFVKNVALVTISTLNVRFSCICCYFLINRFRKSWIKRRKARGRPQSGASTKASEGIHFKCCVILNFDAILRQLALKTFVSLYAFMPEINSRRVYSIMGDLFRKRGPGANASFP